MALDDEKLVSCRLCHEKIKKSEMKSHMEEKHPYALIQIGYDLPQQR